MKTSEIVFFAIAFLLPLVGGGVLLYFVARHSRAGREQTAARETDGAVRGSGDPASPETHASSRTRDTREDTR